MPIKHLETSFELPPGRPPCAEVERFLDLVLREFRWFEPRRYGSVALDEPIDPSHVDLGALVAHYEKHGTLLVAARTDRDFVSICPITTGAPPYTGAISWLTSASLASKASWRATHTKQVLEVMRLFQVPLALAGLKTDLQTKQWRLIPKSIPMEGGKEFTYSTKVFTVRDYSEGLAGLVWRNFYGPPFVRMFGDRLDALPPECRTSLGEELVLVQPYELPTEAGTEAGMARERELISLLGPECFYDHEHHTLPTRRPVLDSLGQPLH
jgi:hypothetical protein